LIEYWLLVGYVALKSDQVNLGMDLNHSWHTKKTKK